jgi:GntR family transcriptional repressor for pyruvate dehydrogenase complex
LTDLVDEEQRAILNIYGSRRKNFEEHVQIYEALRIRNPDLAAARVLAHLEGVREVLLRWNPETEGK